MARIVGWYRVLDYAEWRQVVGDSEAVRQQLGITSAEIFRNPQDPQQIVIVLEGPDLAALRSAWDSGALRAFRHQGGTQAEALFLPESSGEHHA